MSAPNADVTLSASARKRANKKARDAEGAAEAAPPAPAPAAKKAAAKPKAEPKAPEPAPKAKGKAKAKAAEPPAPEPAPAPKAEAKAKGKAQPKAAAEPKAAQPASKASAKAKAKAKKEEEEEETKKADAKGPVFYSEVDDGSRADEWEVSSGVDKKRQKQMEKAAEKKAFEKDRKALGVMEARGNQYIPGMAPVDVQVNQAKGKKGDTAKVNQSVTAAAVTAAAVAAPVDTVNSSSATVKVPENRIGIVVGPKGSTIIMIKEKTGVKTIDMQGEMCTIVGSPDAVALAEHAVRQLVEKGYMALAYDDFEEEGVPCLPSLFPDLIGSKGCVIQLIKKEAKVEVTIPAVPKNAKPGQKFKVTLAGSKEAVKLGKEIISSIAMYGHHEITHPGQTHQEMEIEEWKWRYLIGSKGSEMRHIQNNYKVRVSIPREHSECQNVVVVGEPRDVDRAAKYIEKMMWEAEQPKGRGAPEASADDGYKEEPEEDWMSAYMYKRK